jgi:cold shock CspA family protein
MKKLLVATVVALFTAALTTDIFFRFFAKADGQTEQFFSLFVLLTLGIFIANRVTAGVSPADDPSKQSEGQSADRKRQSRAERKPRKRKPGNSTERKAKSTDATSEPATHTGPRETGTVKWFNRNKGFGFLVRENGEEIFVHFRAIRGSGDSDGNRKTLRDGQDVTFVVVERDKGPQADDVVPV